MVGAFPCCRIADPPRRARPNPAARRRRRRPGPGARCRDRNARRTRTPGMIPFPPWAGQAAEIVTWIVIVAGLIQIALYIVQLFFAGYALHRRPSQTSTTLLWERYGDLAPPIAVIAPAYNEE